MLVSLFTPQTRTGRFLRTLSSSYVLLFAATAYSLGVVPIILNFTGAISLGLWSLVVQFGTYLTLLDAGLSGACIRQFVGPVVRNDVQGLNEKFQNAMALACIQAVLIVLGGFAGTWLVPWLGIPPAQAAAFRSLFFVQCLLVAAEFPFRPFNSLLIARQRFEFNYLATAIGMLLSLGVVWGGMSHGLGLWSLVAAGGFQAALKASVSTICVARLWGLRGFFNGFHVRFETMRLLLLESGSFFSGTFFNTLGGMVQSTLLSRWFGLEGVAAWSVGSKAANLLSQLLSKFYESSFAGLSELFESGRKDMLLCRLGQLFGWVMGLSLFIGTGVCLWNGDFVQVWTKSRIDWPMVGDGAAALWLVALTASRGLAEQAKILLVWRWIRWGPAFEFFLWSCLCVFWAQGHSLAVFVLAMALAPLVSSVLVYMAGLHGIYRATNTYLVSRDATWFFGAGIVLFLGSLCLAVALPPLLLRVSYTAAVVLVFLCLFLPKIPTLLATVREKAV